MGQPQSKPVPINFPLDQLYGTWDELARIPSFFESSELGNVQAMYAPINGSFAGRNQQPKVSVVNTGEYLDGKQEIANGVATVNAPGDLSVKFESSPFAGSYLVLDNNTTLGPNRNVLTIGTNSRNLLWTLLTTKNNQNDYHAAGGVRLLSVSELSSVVNRSKTVAKQNGYSDSVVSQLQFTPRYN